MEFKSPYKQLNRKVNTWCKYTKRLDTYGCGCQHDCDYCYANSLLNFRGFWNVNEPRIANLYNIKNKVKKLSTRDVIRIGSMTDCFQPVEAKERVTYQTILILNQFKINYLIVTKSGMVADDLYTEIYDKNLAHFQITITSTDIVNFEKASPPHERIKAVEKLYKLGFDVSVRLSPFIEQYIDINVINTIKCDKVLIEFLKVNPFIRKSFNLDYSEYSLKYGGYEHLQLNKKIELVKKITGFNQVSVGEYVLDHYKYFKEHVNHNKKDCCNLDNNRHFVNEIQLKLFK